MRRLYIIRHGDAAPLGEGVRRDADRPLTPRGEDDVRRIGSLLARFGQDLRLVYCSPLLRARQTAELVGAACAGIAEIRTTENLAPGFRPDLLLEELRETKEHGDAAVVGHQPDLSVLLASLIECDAASALVFAPGSIACVGFSTGPAPDPTLQWLLTPDLLRHLLPDA